MKEPLRLNSQSEPGSSGFIVLLLTLMLLSLANVSALAYSEGEDEPNRSLQGDIVFTEAKELPAGFHLLSSTWSSADAPFSEDPYIAWREISTNWGGSQGWEVWRCHAPDASNTFSTSEAISAFSGFVTEYFERVSGGRYSPTFTAGSSFEIEPTDSSLYNWACLDSPTTPGNPDGLPGDSGLLAFHEEARAGLGGPGQLEIMYSPEQVLRRLPGTHGVVFGIGGAGALNDALENFGGLAVHEIGHSLGWPHVPVRGTNDPYSNMLDLMSGGELGFVDGKLELGSTAAINLYASGWIEKSDVSEWESSRSTYRLGTPQSPHAKLLVVPTDERGRFYTVSVHPASFDSAAPLGVVVHYVDQTTPNAENPNGDYCIDGVACLLIGGTLEVVPSSSWDPTTSPDFTLTSGDTLTIGSWTVKANTAHSDGWTVELTGEAPGTPSPSTSDSVDGYFEDVSVDHTFEQNIKWLADEGITRGCNPPDNTRFCPDDFVTRGQMAAFLVRALGYTEAGGGDLFVDDDGDTFEGDIDRLGTAGATKGCNPPTNDEFCPDDFVTRGQMAAFLVRALGYADDGGGDLFVDDDGSVFKNDIDKLGTAGVTKGCNPPTNDEFCPDDFVTRGQMAAFLHRALSS